MLSLLLIPLLLVPLATHTLWQGLCSPLRKIPGPWYAKFTSLVLKWHEFKANRTRYIHDLHLKFGPSVRIAPDEVAFASAAAVKEIYCSGGSGYDKTEFYDLFKVYNRRTMFTTLNKDDRKRILADRYANTNVVRSQSLDGIAERAANFVKKCFQSVGGNLDLYICVPPPSYLHSYAFDCITHHLFHPHGANSLELPRDEEIMREVTFDDSLQTAECLDHMAAGIDTTGDALCFLMWELSQPRSLPYQRKLQQELLSHSNSNNPTAVGFDKFPYLDAVVTEGLRCFPAIPMSLPRRVPEGGRVVDGWFVPGSDGNDSLALAEMKMLLQAVYSRFTTLPDATMRPEDMEMSDQLISSRPAGQRCLLRFVPLEVGDGV
ncbi:hypothetical protein N0V88_001960 [Collariella sp. IMI 366227]|nr:hypothetical protein N0V88_001960 [Collariella sp. IMI 366227]